MLPLKESPYSRRPSNPHHISRDRILLRARVAVEQFISIRYNLSAKGEDQVFNAMNDDAEYKDVYAELVVDGEVYNSVRVSPEDEMGRDDAFFAVDASLVGLLFEEEDGDSDYGLTWDHRKGLENIAAGRTNYWESEDGRVSITIKGGK